MSSFSVDERVRTVLPADDVTAFVVKDVSSSASKLLSSPGKKRKRPLQPKIGPGLALMENEVPPNITSSEQSPFRVICTAAGRLVYRKDSHTYFVMQNCKRYVASVGDRVIGVVEERFGEYYRINIFGTQTAFLNRLDFEGATKRNMPFLENGALVYGRVVAADNDMEPQISCKVGGDGMADGGAARKDWMTGEATYGELKTKAVKGMDCQNATSIRVPLGLARELIHPDNVVLKCLGTKAHSVHLPFEICIGVNGVVWVSSSSPEHTIIICNAIKNSEVMTPNQTRAMVAKLLKRA